MSFDTETAVQHIKWLTEHTPNRTSGKGQDRAAAEYICNKMSEYGLDSQILEFEGIQQSRRLFTA